MISHEILKTRALKLNNQKTYDDFDSCVINENEKRMDLSDNFLRFKKFKNLNFQRSKI